MAWPFGSKNTSTSGSSDEYYYEEEETTEYGQLVSEVKNTERPAHLPDPNQPTPKPSEPQDGGFKFLFKGRN